MLKGSVSQNVRRLKGAKIGLHLSYNYHLGKIEVFCQGYPRTQTITTIIYEEIQIFPKHSIICGCDAFCRFLSDLSTKKTWLYSGDGGLKGDPTINYSFMPG